MKIYFCIFSILILEIAAQDDAAAEFDDFENFENPPEKILSRKKRIDEVNDDYDRKADEHENMIKLKNAENEKLVKNEDLAESEEATHGLYKEAEPKDSPVELTEQERIQKYHEELHKKAHQDALARAQGAAQSENTVSHTETVETVHTETKNTETQQVLNNKIQITKTVTNDDGTISEQHFEAEIERVEEDGTLITTDPTPTQNVQVEPTPNDEAGDIAENTENAKNQHGSIMENAIKFQQKVGAKTDAKNRGLKEVVLENGVKIFMDDSPKVEKIKVQKTIEIDGIKIHTAEDVTDESDPNRNLADHVKYAEWDDEYVKSALRSRYLKKRRIDVTATQFVSIDHLRPKLLPGLAPLGSLTADTDEPPKDVDFSDQCVKPWILNGEPILDKCVVKLRKDRRPWCSLDEVFQGNFEFCQETADEKQERETVLEREKLVQEGQELISGWDWRRSVIKSGYEKINEAYQLGHMNATGMIAWAKLAGYFMPLNIKEARSLAEDGALRGRSMDQAVLGFMHAIGVGFKADQAKALLYWSFAAAGGAQMAHQVLGFRYLKGIGVKPNCEKALHHYQYIATRAGSAITFSGGIAKAKLPLEIVREQTLDDSGLHDVNLLNYYELLVTQGETNAMLQLAQLLVDRGYEPDCRRAADLLKKASVDHPVAAARLGRLYMDGRGVPQDWSSALNWLKLAAEKNNPMGQTFLGILYELGKHVPSGGAPKYSDAFQYYSKAADAGFSEAQYRLGMCYYNGFGTKQDIRLAVKYLQLASQHQNLRAILKLAELQSTGRGIPRSCQGAVDMYKNVAERGLYARLFMQAAQQYKQEKYQSAYILYSILSELGFSVAQQNVAQLLEEAEITITGEENKYPRALMNFNRAADQGLSTSRVKVGDYSYYGLGTAEDMIRAGENYRAAAEEGGNSQAFFNLGWMHQHGFGLGKDKHLAKRYYDQAMEVNPTEATLPATMAIIYLQFDDLVTFAAGYVDTITIEKVNTKVEHMVMQYVGVNWDIYFGAFLFCILIFVIAFRRQ